jgi:hypothetical protein
MRCWQYAHQADGRISHTFQADTMQGLVIDVYDGGVLVRGRDFSRHEWVPGFQATIPITATPTSQPAGPRGGRVASPTAPGTGHRGGNRPGDHADFLSPVRVEEPRFARRGHRPTVAWIG